MTQPDEITLTPEGKEGELLSYISDLKKEKQQAIDDVKLLRAALSFVEFGNRRVVDDKGVPTTILYCPSCGARSSKGHKSICFIAEALAATDRPEYREEG